MSSKMEIAIYLLAPLASCIIILPAIYWIINYLKTKASPNFKRLRFYYLDADRGLAEQGLLWLSICTPIAYFLLFGHFAWKNYSPDLSPEGFTEFLKISGLPLGLLSFSIPLSVLVARIHATHQTSVQIQITRHKNNLDSYYAHRKAMFEYFSALKPITYPGEIKGDFHAHPRLHLRFFLDKGASHGTPEVNRPCFDDSIRKISEIQEHIHQCLLTNAELNDRIIHYAKSCNKIYELAGTLTLPNIYEVLKENSQDERICLNSNDSKEQDLIFSTVGRTTRELIGAYRYIRSFLRTLCEFAGQDVSFFDKKTHPAIDKGNQFKESLYTNGEILYYVKKANEESLKNMVERHKTTLKQQENSLKT